MYPVEYLDMSCCSPLSAHSLTLPATEPFDEALDRQIWSVNTERVMWESKVRERRRVMSDQVFDLMYNIEERRGAATWQPSEVDLAAEASGGESQYEPREYMWPYWLRVRIPTAMLPLLINLYFGSTIVTDSSWRHPARRRPYTAAAR
jgi:hypothetical protein